LYVERAECGFHILGMVGTTKIETSLNDMDAIERFIREIERGGDE
jgi:hypothetical protein